MRWAEIDAQQIVFNGHYLMYFDTAIAGYWRALAMPYAETMAVARAAICSSARRRSSTSGSARYDDVLDIGIRCARIGNSSMLFSARRVPPGRSCWSAASSSTSSPIRTRKPAQAGAAAAARTARGFEAGEPMVDVRVGELATSSRPAARPIRAEVFVGEQRIPADMEWDDADADAVHAVAFNRLGRALGTGPLLEHVPGVAKIGRMAVAATVAARRRRPRRPRRAARCRARSAAIARRCCTRSSARRRFYERAGFVRRGPEFDEAGIAHVEMLRVL